MVDENDTECSRKTNKREEKIKDHTEGIGGAIKRAEENKEDRRKNMSFSEV